MTLLKPGFTCRTITPMFLAGGKEELLNHRLHKSPELRAPSIRGQLRWWFRAVASGYLSSHIDMRAHEQRLFGGAGDSSGTASAVTVRVRCGDFVPEKQPMLPHKTGNPSAITPCIPVGTVFEVSLTESPYHREPHTLETAAALFNLAAALGGLGRRSRRGFGAFQPTDESWKFAGHEAVKEHIEKVVQTAQEAVAKFLNPSASHAPRTDMNTSSVADYPILNSNVTCIRIGEATVWDTFIKKLMPQCSAIKLSSKRVLGSGQPRQASTLLVSVVQVSGGQVVPIYTQFYCNTAHHFDSNKKQPVITPAVIRTAFDELKQLPGNVSSNNLLSVSI